MLPTAAVRRALGHVIVRCVEDLGVPSGPCDHARMTSAQLLRDLVRCSRPTSVLDIGANLVDGDPPYQRMLDEGRPFHAHEVLEASWKAAPTPGARSAGPW